MTTKRKKATSRPSGRIYVTRNHECVKATDYPECQARAGDFCVSDNGALARSVHSQRVRAWEDGKKAPSVAENLNAMEQNQPEMISQ